MTMSTDNLIRNSVFPVRIWFDPASGKFVASFHGRTAHGNDSQEAIQRAHDAYLGSLQPRRQEMEGKTHDNSASG